MTISYNSTLWPTNPFSEALNPTGSLSFSQLLEQLYVGQAFTKAESKGRGRGRGYTVAQVQDFSTDCTGSTRAETGDSLPWDSISTWQSS